MSNYARGQETFTYKVTSNIRNFVSLLFFSILVTVCSFCLMIYLKIPAIFWEREKIFFKKSIIYLKKDPFFSFADAIKKFFELSKENILFYETVLGQICLWSLGIGTAIFLALFLFFIVWGRSIKRPNYRRGSELISPKTFNRAYHALIRSELKEIKQDNRFSGPSISFKDFWGKPFICSTDGIKIPSYVLHRHTAILGATGVGKSTLIKWYLEYCRENHEKVIIPDINGEYAAEFLRPGDIVLSLFDQNTAYWDFKSEDIDSTEFAKFLVPSGDEHNKFWWKGARQVVSQLLEKFKEPEELWATLNNEENDISTNLTGLARKIAGKEGTTQAAGITGSSILDFGFLRYLNQWPINKSNKNPFSIYNWAQDQTSNWIFITFSDTDKEIINPLFKLWINTAITGLLKRTTTQIPLNIIIDELATIGKIELLPTALERGRKYGGKIILGYQSENQLLNVYGKDSAGSIKANTGSKFIFRCPEPNEAKELSEYLGRQEVTEKNLGTSFGAKNINDRENISEKETTRNIVLDSEIRDLPDGHFYLKSLSINPTKSRIRKKRWEKIYQPMFEYLPKEKEKRAQEDRISSQEKKINFTSVLDKPTLEIS